MSGLSRGPIVLDGLPLQVRSAGIGVYTRSLVRRMAKLRPDLDFVLLGLSDFALWCLRAVPPSQERDELFPPNVRWATTPLYPFIAGYPLAGLPPLVPVAIATGAPSLYHATNYVLPRRFGAHAVVTVHDLALLRFPELGTAALRRHVRKTRDSVRRAQRVIADSEATRKDLITLLHVPPDKVRVVHLGCDEDFGGGHAGQSRENVARRLGTNQPYLLHVGTIEPRKNLIRLVSAFAAARREVGFPHHLVLAGSPGWGGDEVLRKIHDANLGELVHLVEDGSRAVVRDLYRAADLFVYPSLYEGFGLPPLEAMASETPVVASNAASLPEVVGDAALLVDPLDEAALAHAIVRGLTDEMLRRTLRRAGSKRARLFTWERCARETLSVYEEAASL